MGRVGKPEVQLLQISMQNADASVGLRFLLVGVVEYAVPNFTRQSGVRLYAVAAQGFAWPMWVSECGLIDCRDCLKLSHWRGV